MFDQLIRFWDALWGRVTYKNMVSVGATTAYLPGHTFWLYMPAAGSVHFRTEGRQEKTITLTAGYHPVGVIEIFADSATACEACF